MPRRALRCVVDLKINAISAPGVWLPSREDVYLSICLFGQYRNSCLVPSRFPVFFHEKFRFEKTFYTAVDPSHVADLLEDEDIIFELVQLSEYSDGAVRLATFTTNVREFLYPYPALAPTYASADREILLCRTIAFPGISPKLEFSTATVIKESMSPELDALEDALEEERQLRRLRKGMRSPFRARSCSLDINIAEKSYSRPTTASAFRSRSKSPYLYKKMEDIDLTDTVYNRPPFVVRKLDRDLIGRTPGGPAEKHAKSKKKSVRLSRSPSRTSLSANSDLGLDYFSYPSLKHKYHLNKVIREPWESPRPVFSSHYCQSDDEDAEVAELTSSIRDLYVPRPRPRSVSPVLYRSSFRDRFTDSYSPSNSYKIRERVNRVLGSSYERLNRLTPVDPSPFSSRWSPYRSSLYDSLDDLALETTLARSRRYLY